MRDKKALFGVLLAVILGLSISGFSYFKLKNTEAAKEYVTLPIPVRDISAYSIIQQDDIMWEKFAKGYDGQYSARKIEELVKKVSTLPLHRGQQIDIRNLVDAGEIENITFVTVNIDPSRLAGARVGDIVDVYMLNADQSKWVPGTGSTPVALNARVVRICDSSGQPVSEGGTQQPQNVVTKGVQQASQAVSSVVKSLPATVELAVKPEEAPKVIPGSAPKNTSISLVRKLKPSSIVMPQIPLQEEGKNVQGNPKKPDVPAQNK